jgi:uncharacterized protein (TIGR03083 family)
MHAQKIRRCVLGYRREVKLSPRYEAPAIITIDGSADDQLAPVVRQRQRLAKTLGGLDDSEWSSPTRCEGWTVQDVVAHMITVNGFWQMSTAAGLSGAPTRVLENFDPAATPPLIIAPMRALSPSEVLEQFVASNDAYLDVITALDTDGWSTLGESPAGHVPIRLLAQHALWDCWVHERDIALPLGFTPPVEDDEVLSCLRYAAALSPAFAVSSGDALAGTFAVESTDPDSRFVVEVGDSVAVRDGTDPGDAPCLRGDAVELVEALSIRAPLPDSAPVEWKQLLGGLETAFS